MVAPPEQPSQGGWSEPGASGTPAATDAAPGARAGEPPPRYALGAFLGRGGMGVVHVAHDRVLGRAVALKALAPERAAVPGAAEHLLREAALTAALDHPGVVAVHDRGRLPDGRPFYAMRLVRGRSLGQALGEARAPAEVRALLRHVLAACEAVAHAHGAGLVHRDLKPGNVLIGLNGETQVVDWGLAAPTPSAAARWRGVAGSEGAGWSGAPLGTPGFASPEQAAGAAPDPRHDVWSLGATLAAVLDRAPALATPELAAIAARARAEPMTRRYPDAGALADDLLRWFEGRRVAAHTYGPVELLTRTVAAWRGPLAVAAVGLLALAVAVGVGWRRTATARDAALHAEAQAEAALAALRRDQALRAALAGDEETASRQAVAVLEHREDAAARGALAAFGRAAPLVWRGASAAPACRWFDLSVGGAGGAETLCGAEDGVRREAEGGTRWRTAPGAWSPVGEAQGGEAQGGEAQGGEAQGGEAPVLRGGRRVGAYALLWDADHGTVALRWDTGAPVGRWPLPDGDWVPHVPPRLPWWGDGPLDRAALPSSGCVYRLRLAAVGPDGRVAALCEDGTLAVARAGAPEALRVATPLQGEHVASALAWTPDGRLVAGSLRGRVVQLSAETGAVLAQAETGLGPVSAVQVSPAGRWAALVGAQGAVGLWRLEGAAAVRWVLAPGEGAAGVALDDTHLWVRRGASQVAWALPGSTPAVLRFGAGLSQVAADAAGGRLLVAAGDGAAHAVALADGRAETISLGSRVVKAVAFGPAGRLLSTMDTPHLQVWPEGAAPRPLAEGRRLRRMAALADGRVVGADVHAGLLAWPDAQGAPTELDAGVYLDVRPAGRAGASEPAALLTLDAAGAVRRWAGAHRSELVRQPGAQAADLQRGRLAVALAEAVLLWDAAATASAPRRLAAPGAGLLEVALSPDAARVAAAGLDGRVRVWRTDTGALEGLLIGHRERVVSLAFLPDGDLVSASWDGTARVWSLAALTAPVSVLRAAVTAAWGP